MLDNHLSRLFFQSDSSRDLSTVFACSMFVLEIVTSNPASGNNARIRTTNTKRIDSDPKYATEDNGNPRAAGRQFGSYLQVTRLYTK